MKQARSYLLKVWLTSNLIWPILYLITTIVRYRYNPLHPKLIMWYIDALVFELALTLLPWLIVFYSMKRLCKLGWPTSKIRVAVLIEVECLLLLIVPFGYWVEHQASLTELLYWITYAIPAAACIFVYKLKPVGEPLNILSPLNPES